MQFIVIFFVELFILFILSRFVTGNISHFAYRVTGSGKLAIYLLSFLFLPGTIIHELSHFFAAQLLFVRTGEMEFVPVIHGDSVKLGSVQIEKTDPFRRALIGVAPFLTGTALILMILFSSEQYHWWGQLWPSVLLCYVLFEIGNTMFSSKKDMEGVMELFLAVVIIVVILFLAGVRPPENFFDFLSSPSLVSIFQKGSVYLLFPLGIDVVIILASKLTLRLLRR